WVGTLIDALPTVASSRKPRLGFHKEKAPPGDGAKGDDGARHATSPTSFMFAGQHVRIGAGGQPFFGGITLSGMTRLTLQSRACRAQPRPAAMPCSGRVGALRDWPSCCDLRADASIC